MLLLKRHKNKEINMSEIKLEIIFILMSKVVSLRKIIGYPELNRRTKPKIPQLGLVTFRTDITTDE